MNFDYYLSRPDIGDRERAAVDSVLRSPELALGPWTVRFEELVRLRLGAAHAVAVNSGTSALHLLVRAFGTRPGDEIVTTPFSFVASANAALFEGARPIFADIDETTFNLDPGAVERAIGPRTRAILAVHVFGLPCPMEELAGIASRRGVPLIEDACEALGATYRERPAGAIGAASTLAFYPNKQITTGEGGMVLTQDGEIARLVRSMANQGRESGAGWFDHVRMGYNYRMDEMSAALGAVQMERLDEILAARSRVAASYRARLAEIEGVRPLDDPPWATRSWFVHPVRLDRAYDRDRLAEGMARRRVQTARYFPPIHLLPFYRDRFGHRPGDFPVTERVSASLLALPFYNALSDSDVAEIAGRLAEALAEGRRASATPGNPGPA
ncbi:MAG: DegT/DnrJ/EryC1/StrS family aminotransferase [Planctomycetes bacterium]|nr:DegT/DnrJ/EryC1/StrS family aminotransferase [Planctomycetota bacterium]